MADNLFDEAIDGIQENKSVNTLKKKKKSFIVKIIIALIIFIISIFNTPDIMCDINIRIANEGYRQKLYKESEHFYKRAEAYAYKADKKKIFLVYIYSSLAEIYNVRKDYSTAKKYLYKAISFGSESTDEESHELAIAYNDLANIYAMEKQYALAKNLYYKSLELELNSSGYFSWGYADSCNNIGYVYLKEKNYIEAEKYLKEALLIKERVHGKNSKELIPTFYNLIELNKKTGKDYKPFILRVNEIVMRIVTNGR